MLAAGTKCVDRTTELVMLDRIVGARMHAPGHITDRADLMTTARNIFVLYEV